MSGSDGDFHFKAFISYSHKDKVYADWLHKTLETYTVPRRLVGTQGRDGPIPKRLFPIFRDRDELPSAHDLSEQIDQALRTSAYLIVICSKNSAKSPWVHEEILAYKRLGRENQILALIIDGIPNVTGTKKEKQECFPKALRYAIGPDGNLTDQLREPIAADYKADGKEKAALKVIAGVLGVSLDSLAQRDKQRQKARFKTVSSLVLGSLTLIAAAFGYWWYQQAPHTEYYRTFTTRHGIPEGVTKINEIEALQAYETFAITKKDGRVVEMRLEDSRHSPKAMDQNAVLADTDLVGAAVLKLDYVGERGFVLTLYNARNQPMWTKEYTYADKSKSAATVALKSLTGDVRTLETSATALGGAGSDNSKYRSAITQYRLSFDKKGRVERREYQTAMADPTSDASGSFGNAYVYDRHGLPISIRNLDAEGKFIPLKSGVTQIAIDYYPNALLKTVSWVDDNTLPMLNERGYAVSHSTRDERGNLVQERYTGADGKPALRKDLCIAKTAYKYDLRGDRLIEAYFGTDDTPTLSCDTGVARTVWSYGDDGRTIDESYFGVDAKPILSKDTGVAKVTYLYDGMGQSIGDSYFGTDGKPILRKDTDYAKVVYRYDENGYTLSQENYGTDGKLTLSKPASVARTAWVYDEKGRVTRQAYFGTDAKPVLNREFGAARIDFSYDNRGNETEEKFFGVDDQPILSKDWGVARTTFAYDNRGNKIKIDNFGLDNKPMISSTLGYSRVTYKYDERGNQVRESYFDAEGNPLALASNVATVTKAYDEAGNQTEIAFLNVAGLATPSRELGYSKATWAYDKRGNTTEARYFDAEGKPMLNWVGGFARVTWAFDNRGNKIEQNYFGMKDERIIDYDTNVARTTWAYDAHGHVIEVNHFGIDLLPTMSWKKGYARARMAYDASGNQTEESYFDIAGVAMINDVLGYAKVVMAYDNRGRVIEEAYFGTDGKPVANKLNGVSRITYKYDLRGNRSEAAFFGTDGAPASDNVSGAASYSVTYDDLGQVSEVKGFNAEGGATRVSGIAVRKGG